MSVPVIGRPVVPTSTTVYSTWDVMESLIQRRTKVLRYLSRAHSGDTPYLNTVSIRPNHILTRESQNKKVAGVWLSLGISLAQLLTITSPTIFSKALITLVAEYDYESADAPRKRSMSFKWGKKGDTATEDSKANRNIYLIPQNLPFESLDSSQIYQSLCEVIVMIYAKFLSWNQQQNTTDSNMNFSMNAADDSLLNSATNVYEAFQRADQKLKKLIENLTKELEVLSLAVIETQLKALDPAKV